MSNIPTLQDWLMWDQQVISAVVRQHNLSIKMLLDGTTRHYLLHRPVSSGQVTDFDDYAREEAKALFALLDLLFSHGLATILILNVWPPDIERRESHIQHIVNASKEVLLSDAALNAYRQWDAAVHLYGNWDISPQFQFVHETLSDLEAQFVVLHAHKPQNLLLWGYYAGNGLDETIARSVALSKTLGRLPTEAEVRQACFPWGPENLDLVISGGWLRMGNLDIPPVLNSGRTDLYSLLHLPLDLTEQQLRRILYDRIFLRYAASPVDDTPYDTETLKALRSFYAAHNTDVLGLGELVAGKFWYPKVTRVQE